MPTSSPSSSSCRAPPPAPPPSSTARPTSASIDGKTANGLVRHSERYEILSVIDSTQAGLDAGVVLGGDANGIPICADLADALARLAGRVPTLHLRHGPLQRHALGRRARRWCSTRWPAA